MKGVSRASFQIKWMAATMVPEVNTVTLPIKSTASSGMSNYDSGNEMEFSNVVNSFFDTKSCREILERSCRGVRLFCGCK